MFKFRKVSNTDNFSDSRLYDQNTFYPEFLRDLNRCTKEAVIESPFITLRRTATLLPTIRRLRQRGVSIIINTREPQAHDVFLCSESTQAIAVLQDIGVTVICTGGHHRKLAILDRSVVWEGSLNILSQNDSCEIMRRIASVSVAEQTLRFLNLEKYIRSNR
jgi:hypothetical protein